MERTRLELIFGRGILAGGCAARRAGLARPRDGVPRLGLDVHRARDRRARPTAVPRDVDSAPRRGRCALLAFALPRGDRAETDRAEADRSGFVFGGLLFVAGHGSLAWAQQTVPAGVAALLVGTIPIWMALFDRVAFGKRLPAVAYARDRGRLRRAGVSLRSRSAGAPSTVGALVIVLSAMCWAIGLVYSRGAPLPKRPLVSAGLASLCGGILLTGYSVVTGEIGEATWTSDACSRSRYLIVAGSFVGFTAYVWLLRVGADLARLDVRVRESDRRRRARLADPRRGGHGSDARRRRGRARLGRGDRPFRRHEPRAGTWTVRRSARSLRRPRPSRRA